MRYFFGIIFGMVICAFFIMAAVAWSDEFLLRVVLLTVRGMLLLSGFMMACFVGALLWWLIGIKPRG